MSAKPRSVRISPLAESDLEQIWLYSYRNWSLEQADKYHMSIVSAFDDLAAGRLKGRSVDVREGYLKYPVGSHFIFFRMSERWLDIVRVLHQRMDVDRHL